MLLALRFVKLLAVAALFGGALLTVIAKDQPTRRTGAFAIALPGLGAAWITGFVMAQIEGVSLLSGWILGGLGLSFFASQALLFTAAKPERRSLGAGLAVVVPLVLTVALMVFRPF